MDDYCYDLMVELKKLEVLIDQMNNLRRNFKTRVEHQVNFHSIIVATLFSAIVMFWYATEISDIFTTDAIELTGVQSFVQMFTLSFLTGGLSIILGVGLRRLWLNDYIPLGKKLVSKVLLPQFEFEKNKIAIEAKKVLNQEIFIYSKLPKKYLNVESVNYLMKVMESGEAVSLDQALEIIKLEIKNSKVKNILSPKENLLERAQKSISEDLRAYC